MKKLKSKIVNIIKSNTSHEHFSNISIVKLVTYYKNFILEILIYDLDIILRILVWNLIIPKIFWLNHSRNLLRPAIFFN